MSQHIVSDTGRGEVTVLDTKMKYEINKWSVKWQGYLVHKDKFCYVITP